MVSQALSAIHLHIRDQHYIVVDDKVQIVDESTGRILADRQWQAGLHQMVEVKEGLEPGASRKTLGQITYQHFFRRYLWFGGMTGTGAEVARELQSVYDLPTTRVPTHRRGRRRNRGVQLFGGEAAKLRAIARRVRRLHRLGRPVLVGTRSVAASEAVSAALERDGLAHTVLNALHDQTEADIIARAGETGAITVATNMAGRGTDIKLTPAARRAGGLHVILTEYHESARVDRQLFGRAGRQGDPGSREALVALDDSLFQSHAAGLARAAGLLTLGYKGRLPGLFAPLLRLLAQGAAQRQAYRRRRDTLTRSDKLEKSLAFTRRPV
jgi:preprotein translocase subunit SecA